MTISNMDNATDRVAEAAAGSVAAAKDIGRAAEAAYGSAKEGVQIAADLAKARSDVVVQEISARIVERPLTSMAVAGAVGFLLARAWRQ